MRLAWTQPLPASPLGLALAREPGGLLVWDAEPTLGRYDPQGRRQLRQRAPAGLALAAMSDDGATVAGAGATGQVWLLTADLVPLWQRGLSKRPVALALDHLGRRVAVADEAGGLHVFDRAGKRRWQATCARPLARLAFVPEAGAVVAAADFGLVCAFDAAGKLLWRDGLAAHAGDLAVSGDGARIVVACFTGGLARYALDGPRAERFAEVGAARLVAMSYAGDIVVTADLERALCLRGADLAARGAIELTSGPVAVAVEALGGAAVCALAGGQLVGVDLGG